MRTYVTSDKWSLTKLVAVAYERWSLTRGSNYSDLTGEILVFWKSGRLRELVARGGSTVFGKPLPLKLSLLL